MSEDRVVHAELGEMQVVRYDRAGHWYLEDPGQKRQRISLSQAVVTARIWRQAGGRVYLGRPGGGSFDHKFLDQHDLGGEG